MEYYFASLFYSCTVYVESRCYGEGKCSSEVTDQDSNGVSQPARTTVLSLTQMQRQFFFFLLLIVNNVKQNIQCNRFHAGFFFDAGEAVKCHRFMKFLPVFMGDYEIKYFTKLIT